MSFESSAYTLAGFLVLFGTLFIFLSSRERREDKRFMGGRTTLLVFGFFYLGLAHFALLSGMSFTISQTNLAPCENIIANITTEGAQTNSTNSTYSYVDSCSSRALPTTVTRLYTTYLWLLVADMIAVLIGGLYLFVRRVGKW